MGKEKKDKRKKGKGAEKTAEKTEKKLKHKFKKELAAKGEDDIESMVRAIEEEEDWPCLHCFQLYRSSRP